MSKFTLILLWVLCIAISANAQQFQGVYGSTETDGLNSLAQINNGQIVAAGFSDGFDAASDDIIFTSINLQGDTTWMKIYGGIGIETVKNIIPSEDGGFYFIGSSSSYSLSGDLDMIYGQMSENGDPVWVKRMVTPGAEQGRDINITSDGGLILTGISNYLSQDNTYDLFLVKTDSEGNPLWSHIYGVDDYDVSLKCTEGDNGENIYIWGHYEGEFSQEFDGILIQLNSEGELNWAKSYGGPENELAWDIMPHDNGGVMVTGDTSSSGAGLTDMYVMHIGANGIPVWANTYGTYSNDHATCIARGDNNSVIVGGLSSGTGAGHLDMLTLSIDLMGVMKYAKSYGGDDKDAAYDIIYTNDGGHALAGYTRSYGEGFNSGYITKVNANGTSDCFEYFSSNYEAIALDFDVTDVPVVIKDTEFTIEDVDFQRVTGNSHFAQRVCGSPYELIAESESFTVSMNDEDQSSDEPIQGILAERAFNVFPNPANEEAFIEMTLEQDETIQVTLMDLNGRSVWSQSQFVEANWQYRWAIPIQDMNAGIYFLNIQSNHDRHLQRLIIE